MHIGILNRGSLLIVAGVVLIRKHTIILVKDSSRYHIHDFVCKSSEKRHEDQNETHACGNEQRKK